MKTGLKVTAEVFVGSQGGRYYITNHGTKHYGHPPTGTVITAEHHVGEGVVLRDVKPKKGAGSMTLAEAHETFARLDKKGVGNLSDKDFNKYAEAHDIIKGKKLPADGAVHGTGMPHPTKVNPTSLTGEKFKPKLVENKPTPSPPVIKPPLVIEKPVEKGPSLHEFSKSVQSAADASGVENRFGRSKVFIGDLAKKSGMPEKEFKEKLLAAHRAGHVELSRADLVQSMDKKKVADSEIKYMNATFHFIRANNKKEAREC